ncbi:DUF1800 domain-containing protein [Aureibaculum sp. A20]|uniref:DUF1800 domain-containing protein n=1 Tax=Aureibaculum flavum TaxID=2795986 RepID=A0ABS0WSK7_9FLAO|nr:DUF1800 domain-containing protein [Aureibaculum flavum]MBJ2174934.1 DUF1800 domain-containing protein [Aureibaculum flavum]
MKAKHIQHLFWRAGFGITPAALEIHSKKNRKKIVAEFFENSKKSTPLTVDTSELISTFLNMDKTDKLAKQKLAEANRQKQFELNSAWLLRLTNSKEILREKMTLFWANHFVCQDNNTIYIEQFNNTLRKHALGNLNDFVKAISKETAMIRYLNTKQNRKLKPNENFARELLELFTLGTGNYTETDIKEAASAFTGYNHNLKGAFHFNKKQHDFKSKTFLGETGNFNGDAIIDIILKQKDCATFICKKIYQNFVNDTPNSEHVNQMAELFYPKYDIGELMQFVFNSDWFYEDNNIGCLIKSPVELMIGMYNVVPFEFHDSKSPYYIQKLLNQVLLRPPNVAGWKGGKTWIDSNTILIRLKLPSVLLNNAIIALEEKGEFEDSYQKYYANVSKRKKAIKTTVDWNTFDKNFKKISISEMKDFLLVSPLNTGTRDLLHQLTMDNKQEVCVQLMSLPEYQLC